MHTGRGSVPVGTLSDEAGKFFNQKPEVIVDDDGSVVIQGRRDRAVTLADAHQWVLDAGFEPDDYVIGCYSVAYGENLFSNKVSAYPKSGLKGFEPKWPVIQPAAPVKIKPVARVTRSKRWKTAVLAADTQIGYRRYDDGTLDPFHDEDAINVALQIIQIENPDRTVLMGDILDLASQGRFAQEATFAQTTQPAIDRTGLLAAQLRQETDGEIDFIEGNHDKRLQNFVEANALAAFGLKRANLPESWPVMSLPNLLNLDEYGITYHDAYPTAHLWINNVLRCEHGTKVNSNGSTVAKYANETPHISRASGHTHRQEAQGKTTFDRFGPIRSMHINPGCLCRIDGAVPSVKGAIGADGHPGLNYEDWQQGVAVVRYTQDEFFVELVQIIDGHTVYQGQEIRSSVKS